MSFCTRVKKELCAVRRGRDCCLKAECCGLLLYARAFSAERFELATESRETAELARELLRRCFSVRVRVSASRQGAQYLVRTEDVSALWAGLGLAPGEARIPEGLAERDCCAAAFLRGAFLSCGSVIDPNKGYHLELSAGGGWAGRQLFLLLLSRGFRPKQTERGGESVIYFKESESIEDLLTLMGATASSLELMEVKVYKDVRNRINRRTNCETANLTKTADAAAQQCEAIRRLREAGALDGLSPALREAAELRAGHPELSLSELCVLAGGTVSRSGLNHRLQRLAQLARELA